VWQARRTVDGWEIMPSVVIGEQITTWSEKDIRANFDEAYLDNPERMLRVVVPDEPGTETGEYSEEFGIGLDAKVPWGIVRRVRVCESHEPVSLILRTWPPSSR